MKIAGPLAGLLLCAAFVGAAFLGRGRARAAPDLSRWDALVEQNARAFRLDPNLLRGLMAAESGGDPDARSRAGAIGLLQLMPATAAEQARRLRLSDYAEARLTEPALNVRLGASLLARLLERFGGEEAFALAAYNAGPTRVKRWRERAPDLSARDVILREGFEETRLHMQRVLRFRDQYRAQYGAGGGE